MRIITKKRGASIGNLKIITELPGRIRLKQPSLYKKQDYCEYLEYELSDISGLKQIKINSITCSILLDYDINKTNKAKLIKVIEKSFKKILKNIKKPKPQTSLKNIKVLRDFDDYLRIKSDLFKNIKNWQGFLVKLFHIPEIESVEIDRCLGTALIKYNSDKINKNHILRVLRKKLKNINKELVISSLFKAKSNGNKVKFTRYGNFITNWQIIHELPGRIRIKQSALYKKRICCEKIDKALFNTVGVDKTKVSATTSSFLITYDEKKLSKQKLIKIMEDALQSIPTKTWKKDSPGRNRLAFTTMTFAWTTATSFMFPWMTPFNFALVTYTAVPIFKESWQAIKKKKIKVDVLDATVITFCLAMNQVAAAAMMVWVLDVADKVLDHSQAQSRKQLDQIFGKQARFAWLVKDKQEIEVPVEKLQKNDTIVVSTGEPVPVDGVVCAGNGMVDQHALTGESAPVEKEANHKVFASTVLLAGKLYVTVQETGENTVESKIMKIINQSAKYKPRLQGFGEKIADKMVIPTLALAGIGAALRGSGASLAIINADYGTGIRVAAPTAVLACLANAAKNGIVIKKGDVLETLPKIDAVLFDKTGTLTHEVPEVTNITTCNSCSQEKILLYVAAAEQRFSHPIAKAIIQKANEHCLKLPKRDDSRFHVGYGIEVGVNGNTIKVGSQRYMEMQKIMVDKLIKNKLESLSQNGGTGVLVAIDDMLAGMVELQTSHRPEAYHIIQSLKQKGIETVLISGDNEATTKKIAEQLGMDRYFAEVLPEDKANYVKLLKKQGKKVAMVGDGINDSPALSLADVSISLRGGSDIATDVADVIFMDGNLEKFNMLFDIGHRLEKNVKRSFAMIAIPNTLCILGALLGVVGLGTSLLLNNGFNVAATINGALPLANATASAAPIAGTTATAATTTATSATVASSVSTTTAASAAAPARATTLAARSVSTAAAFRLR